MANQTIDVMGASIAALVLSARMGNELVRKGLVTAAEQEAVVRATHAQLDDAGKSALATIYPNFGF